MDDPDLTLVLPSALLSGSGNPTALRPKRKILFFPCFGRQCLRLFRFASFGLYRRGNEDDEYNREDQERREQDKQDFHFIRPFVGHLTTRLNNNNFASLAEREFCTKIG